MRRGRAAKAIVLITLLSFTVLASGCYGGFNLTRSLYKWNGNIEASKDKQANTVVQSLVMVVLVIVPVYGLATLADALVVNSIEFWTGKNPVTVKAEPAIRTVDKGDERYVQTLTRTASGKEMRVDYYKQGRLVNTLVVRQEGTSSVATGDLRWSDGRHEAFQVTYAGEETYIIGHMNAAGDQQYWVVPSREAANISRLVQTPPDSPAGGGADSPALLFQ
jgi:hypothetical protein